MEIVFGVLRWRASLDWILERHAKPASRGARSQRSCWRSGSGSTRSAISIASRSGPRSTSRCGSPKPMAPRAAKAWSTPSCGARCASPKSPPFPTKEEDPLGLPRNDPVPPSLARGALPRKARRRASRGEVRGAEPDASAPSARLRAHRIVERAREALASEGVETEIVSEAPALPSRSVSGALAESSLPQRRARLPSRRRLAAGAAPSRGSAKSDRVLDVCAAPGGKATAMSELASEGSVIADRPAPAPSAASPRDRREGFGRRTFVRSWPTGEGFRSKPGSPGSFSTSRAAASARCAETPTSSGAFRRRTSRPLAALQLELLRSSSRLLAEDGRLVYATCSTEPEENEEVVERFLSESPGFRRVDAALEPSRVGPPPGRMRTATFAPPPKQDDMDGYFAAILVRR